MDLGRKWLVDRFNKNCAIDVKMDGPVLEMKSSSKIQGFIFLFYIRLGLLHYLYC